MTFTLSLATSVYIYDSVPGIILIVVRFLAFVYLVWGLANTYKEEADESKRKFYLYFGLGVTLWFLSLPVTVLCATGMPAWYRERVVDAIQLVVATLGFLVISFLLWPSHASKYFQISGPDVFKGTVYERL